jgi:ribulose 1,5-bisphosphate carboxylase large subunit-like protein
MITIKGRLDFPTDGSKPSENDVHRILRQIANDAIYGTFAEYPRFWFDKLAKPDTELADYKLSQESTYVFNFKLLIDEDLFAIQPGGFQHLISMLAGDLFNIKPPMILTVTDIVLPDKMQNEAFVLFRENRAHSIDGIRQAFALANNEPLLAFSFKPRNGLRFEVLQDVTLKVLKAGIHLVELDTRNLNLQEKDIAQLVDLSQKAMEVGKSHITRFAPNLSVPSYLVVDISRRFIEVQKDPIVIKIDGGLDGISACQAIRNSFPKQNDAGKKSPIITCYPLLRRQLANRISDSFLVGVLTLSGADIIYPGSRPSLQSTARELDAAEEGNLKTAVMRYHEIVKKNWSMPSIAGGIHAPQLHAFYELLGPKVAFFLGGAIALHKDGPVEGASLCVRVIRNSMEIRNKFGIGAKCEDLNHKLIKECESAYANKYPYIPPEKLFIKYPGLNGWFAKSR